MMPFALLSSWVLLQATTLPALVEQDIAEAASHLNARTRIVDFKLHLKSTCTVQKTIVPIVSGSSEIAVRLFGQTETGASCEGWAWVKTQVFVKAWVTRQAIGAGDKLSDNVMAVERELLPGRPFLTALSSDARAAFRLGPNVPLEPAHVRADGPSLGQKVIVRLSSGSLRVEQEGRTVPCGRDMACALLPNGKRVEGRWDGERIVLENL